MVPHTSLLSVYSLLMIMSYCTAVSATAPRGTANRLHPDLLPAECGRPPPRVSSNRTNFLRPESAAAAAGQLPYQARLLRLNNAGRLQHVCSGALITRRHVVTAAHCVTNVPLGRLFVRVAELRADRADPNESTVAVENIDVHREFIRSDGDGQHDIALLRLLTAVQLSPHVQPVCLPLPDASISSSTQVDCHMSGWAGDEDTPLASRPLRLTSNTFCSAPEVYPVRFSAVTMICSMPEVSSSSTVVGSSCSGDGGAPLVCAAGSTSRLLVGVSSHVDTARCSFHPQLNARVTAFVDWLLRRLRCDQDKDMEVGEATVAQPDDAELEDVLTGLATSQKKQPAQPENNNALPPAAAARQWPGCGEIKPLPPLVSMSGQFVDSSYAFPWTAAVYERSLVSGRLTQLEFRCGGAVLTDRWILTAAHCVPHHQSRRHWYVVRVGGIGWASEDGPTSEAQLSVNRVVFRPDYDRNRYETSLVLLRTESRIPFSSRVGAVCLPSAIAPPSLRPAARRQLLIAGFGSPRPRQDEPAADTRQREPTGHRLKWAKLRLTNREKCVQQYVASGSMTAANFGNSTFCTKAIAGGGLRSEFQCAVNLQDKGSVVVDFMRTGTDQGLRWRAVGVVFDRWLYDCASDDFPHINIALAPFSDWIRKITGI